MRNSTPEADYMVRLRNRRVYGLALVALVLRLPLQLLGPLHQLVTTPLRLHALQLQLLQLVTQLASCTKMRVLCQHTLRTSDHMQSAAGSYNNIATYIHNVQADNAVTVNFIF